MKTFTEAIAARGLDEAREVRNLKRRLRHQRDPHAHYYWATTETLTPYVRRYGNADQISRDLARLRAAVQFDDTQAYVETWARLNHLRV